jgi:hypothetical protein
MGMYEFIPLTQSTNEAHRTRRSLQSQHLLSQQSNLFPCIETQIFSPFSKQLPTGRYLEPASANPGSPTF